jgi:hypothetical protein
MAFGMVRSVRRLAFLAAVVAVAIVLSESDGGTAATRRASAASPGSRAAEAPCSSGGEGTTRVSVKHDVVFGPLVLLGGRRWAAWTPDAFDRHGYKIPVTLPQGVRATLSVPATLRGRVGLVFTLATQDRVFREGVRGADTSVRFTACPAGDVPGRTGWPGGLVVDRPRCATLVVKLANGHSVRRRVPLGRRCPPPG